jgi:hypothetical protein
MVSLVARPPGSPWCPIVAADPKIAYAPVYLSDNAAKYPIRGVTLPYNNKSDPNLETQTFGLFSTCERQMRAGVVQCGAEYLFFVTRRDKRRVICGYYHLAWYARAAGATAADFALAADRMHFVYPAIPLVDLPSPAKEQLTARFRNFRRIDTPALRIVLGILNDKADRTRDYIAEIDRLERVNRSRTGYRCWRRKDPFSWDDAAKYLMPEVVDMQLPSSNRSPTDWWLCVSCDQRHYNRARLKICPHCSAVGTVRAVHEQEFTGVSDVETSAIH